MIMFRDALTHARIRMLFVVGSVIFDKKRIFVFRRVQAIQTIRIGQSVIYHNRHPTNRLSVVCYQPGLFKNVNIWAEITHTTSTLTVMFGLNLNAAGYEIIVEQHIFPFIN